MEDADIQSAAAALGLDAQAFIDRYTTLARNRAQLTLIEKPDGSCIFLEGQNICRIYAARPRQCREFPSTWQVDGCPGLDALGR